MALLSEKNMKGFTVLVINHSKVEHQLSTQLHLIITNSRAYMKVTWLGETSKNVTLGLLVGGRHSSSSIISLPINFWPNSDLFEIKKNTFLFSIVTGLGNYEYKENLWKFWKEFLWKKERKSLKVLYWKSGVILRLSKNPKPDSCSWS